MNSTEQRLVRHLLHSIDYAYEMMHSNNSMKFTILRSPFVTSNGIKVSIQQGSSHYCQDEWHFELGFIPHRKILDPYGSEEGGSDIYANVPFDVVVAYIDELEAADKIESLRAKVAELEAELRSFYTNTNHGYTMQDRHFNAEGDAIYDQNFDHDACIKVMGDFAYGDSAEYAKMICGALNSYNAEQAISLKLYESAKNLRDVKGRHHSEIAMNRLIEVLAEYEKEHGK